MATSATYSAPTTFFVGEYLNELLLVIRETTLFKPNNHDD